MAIWPLHHKNNRHGTFWCLLHFLMSPNTNASTSIPSGDYVSEKLRMENMVDRPNNIPFPDPHSNISQLLQRNDSDPRHNTLNTKKLRFYESHHPVAK